MNQKIRAIRTVDGRIYRGNFFGITFAEFFRHPNKRGNFNHVDVADIFQRMPRKIPPVVNFFAVVGNVTLPMPKGRGF